MRSLFFPLFACVIAANVRIFFFQNEIQNPDFTKLSDTDLIISNTRKMSLKHSPAAMVAAGRAQIEVSECNFY